MVLQPMSHFLAYGFFMPSMNSQELSPYAKKLRDPRWQKKRLQVLERDSFKCQACLATKKPLHVHHRIYVRGRDPWDYPSCSLVTLCEDCHEHESHNRFLDEEAFLHEVRAAGFLGKELRGWAVGIHFMKLLDLPAIVASAYYKAFLAPETQRYLIDQFLKTPRKKAKIKKTLKEKSNGVAQT